MTIIRYNRHAPGDGKLRGSFRAREGMLLALFLFVAFAVFLFPHDALELKTLMAVARPARANEIFVTGNSVVSATSMCDEDVTTLAGHLGIASGRPVVDLSRPGQGLDFAENILGWLAQTKSSSTIIAYVSLFQFNVSNSSALGPQLAFSLTNPYLPTNSLRDRFSSGIWLDSGAATYDRPFDYRGVHYPTTTERTRTYYVLEKGALRCPQTSVGINRRFIEANYWYSYLGHPADTRYFADMASLQQRVTAHQGVFLVVLLPVDLEDVHALNASLSDAITARRLEVASQLKLHHIAFLDLSSKLAASSFTDRYCACGHMNETGRIFVANATATALRER